MSEQMLRGISGTGYSPRRYQVVMDTQWVDGERHTVPMIAGIRRDGRYGVIEPCECSPGQPARRRNRREDGKINEEQ